CLSGAGAGVTRPRTSASCPLWRRAHSRSAAQAVRPAARGATNRACAA
ncbi:MAG: hypothetical protein AVDCRST_MAG38-1241, partial [uncultured Solirubrobacteraceae bacterium]